MDEQSQLDRKNINNGSVVNNNNSNEGEKTKEMVLGLPPKRDQTLSKAVEGALVEAAWAADPLEPVALRMEKQLVAEFLAEPWVVALLHQRAEEKQFEENLLTWASDRWALEQREAERWAAGQVAEQREKEQVALREKWLAMPREKRLPKQLVANREAWVAARVAGGDGSRGGGDCSVGDFSGGDGGESGGGRGDGSGGGGDYSGGDGGVRGGDGDGSGGDGNGNNDGVDKTEGGGKMGTKMEPKGQHDNRNRFSYHAGDENWTVA